MEVAIVMENNDKEPSSFSGDSLVYEHIALSVYHSLLEVWFGTP